MAGHVTDWHLTAALWDYPPLQAALWDYPPLQYALWDPPYPVVLEYFLRRHVLLGSCWHFASNIMHVVPLILPIRSSSP